MIKLNKNFILNDGIKQKRIKRGNNPKGGILKKIK